MHIVIGSTPSVKKDPTRQPSFYSGRENGKIIEKRSNKFDRRKGNRDGVIVSLSIPNDRRALSERRRK